MGARSRVSIETSVIGVLSSHPSGSVHVASKQLITWRWWQEERDRCDLHISRVVMKEISASDPEAARERRALVEGIPILAASDEVTGLGDALLRGTGLPHKAEADATHMAFAAVHGMDIMLTWNCRHIANASLRPGIERICLDAGYQPPIMCTPEECFDV